jgi:opacity protein-like surface antigen
MHKKSLAIVACVFAFATSGSVALAAPPWWKTPSDPIGPTETEAGPPKTAPSTVAKTSSLSAGKRKDYLVLKGGVYSPQSDDLTGFDTGFNGEVAFGTYVTENLIGELGVGYFESKASDSITIAGFGSISSDAKVSAYPITLSAKYAYPLSIFEPYLSVGLGLYICKIDLSSTVTGVGSFSDSDSDTTFGFNVGLGGNLYITKDVFVGVEGKYIWVEPSFSGVDIRFDGFTATLNVGYRF